MGHLILYWILIISGHINSCVTVQRLTEDEKHKDDWQGRMKDYDGKIKKDLISKIQTYPKVIIYSSSIDHHLMNMIKISLTIYHYSNINTIIIITIIVKIV